MPEKSVPKKVIVIINTCPVGGGEVTTYTDDTMICSTNRRELFCFVINCSLINPPPTNQKCYYTIK